MTEISQEKKQFIDDNFYEGLSESELDKAKFELLSSPYELFYLANKHNWDDGVKLMQWIAESDICSEATALQLFWLAQPKEYQVYKLTDTIKRNDTGVRNDTFYLIKTILERFENGFYKKTELHFDPTILIETEQEVPAFMKEPTNGAETYVYLEKKEVERWFGEILENKIEHCDSTMELFNIASFTNTAEWAKLILSHPLCDKGIAIMLFWRLKTFASFWYETNSMLAEIVEKVRNNKYPEIVAYNPKTDTEIKMKEPKPKWTIPAIMSQPI